MPRPSSQRFASATGVPARGAEVVPRTQPPPLRWTLQMTSRFVAALLVAIAVSCTGQVPDAARATAAPAAGLLPSDPPLGARPVLPAMPADCHSMPELAPTWTAPQASTVPVARVLDRARQNPDPVHGTARWFEKVPTDSTLVTLRDGRTMWMVGYSEPPPFPNFGRTGGGLKWTAWIALFDAKTGDFVTALSCGRVATGGADSPSLPTFLR
jgi:hypothetical protein